MPGAVACASTAPPTASDSTAVWLEQKITPADGGPGFNFGNALAFDGTTAVIGDGQADADNGGAGYEGAVYVFGLVDGVWTQTQKLIADDGVSGDYFGGSVAIDGDTLVVTADDAAIGSNTAQGAVYVFNNVGGSWVQMQKLSADDGATNDYFGISAALAGGSLFVGASGASANGNSAQGKVYVFSASGGNWSQGQVLSTTDGAAYDHFGNAIAASADSLLVGVPNSNLGGSNFQGAVIAYANVGGQWTRSAVLTADDATAGAYFGFSVALDNNRALIGAWGTNIGGIAYAQGEAYLFSNDAGVWSETQQLVAADGVENDYFGYSVALEGDVALIGAVNAAGDYSFEGAAYRYTNAGSSWAFSDKLSASDGADSAYFGNALALSQGIALVAAHGAAIGDNAGEGAAYFYSNDTVFADGFDTSAATTPAR